MVLVAGRLFDPKDPLPAYELVFLEGLAPALEDIQRFGIRVAVNAGQSDTEGLWRAVVDLVEKKGLGLKVWSRSHILCVWKKERTRHLTSSAHRWPGSPETKSCLPSAKA